MYIVSVMNYNFYYQRTELLEPEIFNTEEEVYDHINYLKEFWDNITYKVVKINMTIAPEIIEEN